MEGGESLGGQESVVEAEVASAFGALKKARYVGKHFLFQFLRTTRIVEIQDPFVRNNLFLFQAPVGDVPP